MNFSQICVIGLGYIGLPTAGTFASKGIKVVGVDNNPQVLASLRAGKVHIHEPGISEVIGEGLQSGNFQVAEIPVISDAFIIAVPTPFMDGKKADLSYVRSAAESILPVLRQGNLVILESTSPPLTTTGIIQPILERTGLKAGKDFFLAYSPERVLPGQILRELVENARVIGGIDRPSAEAGRDLYGIFVKGEIVLTDATTSEMVKLMENTYRDVNIAVANEFSRLAEKFGIDVREAIAIANRHPRVKILSPGPGVGGHCISVDPWFLVEAAPEITPLIHTARNVNDAQPDFVIARIKEIIGSIEGKRITLLGMAYKPDVDDVRESPAVEIAHKLAAGNAVVTFLEPYKAGLTIPGAVAAGNIQEAIGQADLIVLLVAHTEFKEIDAKQIVNQTTARFVLDTVGVWDRFSWQTAGFVFHALGDRKNS
jgi:UDP-N-acetyl-D-mannosaminuronic acid dehydrogenase